MSFRCISDCKNHKPWIQEKSENISETISPFILNSSSFSKDNWFHLLLSDSYLDFSINSLDSTPKHRHLIRSTLLLSSFGRHISMRIGANSKNNKRFSLAHTALRCSKKQIKWLFLRRMHPTSLRRLTMWLEKEIITFPQKNEFSNTSRVGSSCFHLFPLQLSSLLYHSTSEAMLTQVTSSFTSSN